MYEWMPSLQTALRWQVPLPRKHWQFGLSQIFQVRCCLIQFQYDSSDNVLQEADDLIGLVPVCSRVSTRVEVVCTIRVDMHVS